MGFNHYMSVGVGGFRENFTPINRIGSTTPSCVVRCLVEMLAPDKGRIYDPACGSDCFRADDGARWQFGVRFAVSSNN